MFALKDGRIIPGIGIGALKLGCTEKCLLDRSDDFLVEARHSTKLYIGEDVMVWVDEHAKEITQITAFGKFSGKLLGKFGVGSYLSEIETELRENAQQTYDICPTYVFPSLPGVYFELLDIDIPDEQLLQIPYEKIAPIGTISVAIPNEQRRDA